ncbi:adenosine receptor A2b-like [Lineus longissimus]|uniref:adenosine receptor A2b-like n=1 Tax=Lineus longissimus TaxID=88925 RepID=UPI00315CEE4B
MELIPVIATNETVMPAQKHDLSLTYAILLGALIPLTCIENCLIILCIWRTFKLHTINNMFVMNMAVADLLVGLIAAPMTLLFALQLPIIYDHSACLARFGILYTTCGASLMTLTCISFNRYLTVLHPLSYPRRMKPKRVKQIIGVIWVIITFVGFLPFVGFSTWIEGKPCDFYSVISTPYALVAIFGLGILLIAMSGYYYGMIFSVAYRQRQRDQCPNRSTSSSLGTGLLMTIFVLFWLPYLLMSPIRYFSDMNRSLLNTINNFTIILAISNSMINPIISFATDKTLRAVLFHMCAIRPQQDLVSTSYHATAVSGVLNTWIENDLEKTQTIIKMDDLLLSPSMPANDV